MGSLKDEMRGLSEDRQLCEKADDGEHPGSSDGCAVTEGPQINTSQKSTTQEDYEPKLLMNTSHVEESNGEFTGEVCDNSDQTDSKDSKLSDTIPLTQQSKAETTTTADTTTSTQSVSNEISNKCESAEENMDLDRQQQPETKSISVAVPGTPDPTDPRSPAPFGQHHMRTQVSLEVVQCHSAATSPMTPPEGGHSFFFPPRSFGGSGAMDADTKDAELQVGTQVQFCSVATSPMTPKTPYTTAFPELIGRETVQKVEKTKKTEDQGQSSQHESSPSVTKHPAEAESEITDALKSTTPKELTEDVSCNTSQESSATKLKDSQEAQEGSDHQYKQQRVGSMDQDITILVTQHGNTEEEEDKGESESSICPIEADMVKIDEVEEDNSDMKKENGKEKTSNFDQIQGSSNIIATEESSISAHEQPKSEVKSDHSKEKTDRCDSEELSLSKSAVPESPAPFGCHNIRTQVSLEVVQCQSVATSPMTPPEGDQAFYFPSSLGKRESVGTDTKDAEMQVGRQVEFRSVATAPMTPRTPIATTFPEIMKETSIEEKIIEEEGENNEEPVQEVSWDEKGMTWEVYGAVVEVSVLGSAIQKHLEKQVKKQKRQPSMPPPPPLNPSGRAGKRGAGGDGKVSRRRRNPFRQMMENMQQPHCCSRAHTTE
uniref:G protein-regulated inducer of neurite outgrowth C-terminal domain-containing protein n=1 Tax=Sphaeramia orbicularis TaxID=375764 RepID=A0A673BL55_9TELE